MITVPSQGDERHTSVTSTERQDPSADTCVAKSDLQPGRAIPSSGALSTALSSW